MNLFVYSHGEEYLTRILRTELTTRPDWRCIDTRQFTENVEFEEILEQDSFEQNWRIDATPVLEYSSARLLDRVFSFAPSVDLFQDRHFAVLELDALFFYRRNQSTQHISTLMHLSPSQWALPLTTQWSKIARELPLLKTPHYEYPYSAEKSDLDPKQIIVADFASTENWRPGNYAKQDRAFAFERPEGKVHCVLATPHGSVSSNEVDQSSEQACQIASSICRVFGVWFAEVVLFESGGLWTFGMISSQPSRRFSEEQLHQFVKKELEHLPK